jgi:hypothetical protein
MIVFDPQNQCFSAITDLKIVGDKQTAFLQTVTVKAEDAREYHQPFENLVQVEQSMIEDTQAHLMTQLAVLAKVRELTGMPTSDKVIKVEFSSVKKDHKKS